MTALYGQAFSQPDDRGIAVAEEYAQNARVSTSVSGLKSGVNHGGSPAWHCGGTAAATWSQRAQS